MSTPTPTSASAAPPTGPGRTPVGAVPGWRLIAAREVSVKLRDKTFVLSTAFLLVLVVASIAFTGFMSGRAETVTVAVVGGDGERIVAAAAELVERQDGNLTVQARIVEDADAAQPLLTDADVDVALLPLDGDGDDARWELVGHTVVDSGMRDLLTQAVAGYELERNAAAVGATPEAVLAGTGLDDRVLEPAAMDEALRFGLAFTFAILFYVTALVFGMSIAQSVIEEKQSRVVEILAATVPVRQLLAGKVIGNSLLAIGQVVLLAAVGLVGLALSGQGEVLALMLSASIWFVVFFLLGFGALACVWAVAGSVATRQEDLQATTMPVQTIVIVALLAGLAGSGQLLAVASFVPLVSSVAMPVRLLAGDVPLWQPLVSAGLVVLTGALLIALGARLYEGSLLRTDRRTRLREALTRD